MSRATTRGNAPTRTAAARTAQQVPQGRWPYLLPCLAILLLAAGVVRVCASLNDLWLDEILAVNASRHVSSLLDIFRTAGAGPDSPLRSEVNHQLYTLYLHAIGTQGPLVSRLPSVFAGLGAVLMAGLIGRRRDEACALLAAMLVAGWYVLTVYSSEARGYALAVFFALLSYYWLERYFDSRRPVFAAAFSLAATVGFLAHVTFASFYLAALAWTIYRLVLARAGWRRAAAVVMSCHAVPLVAIAWLYAVHIRGLVSLGGTSAPSLIHSYGTALAWAVGTPSADAWRFVACVVGAVALHAGISRLWRERSDTWLLYLGTILVVPVVLIVARGSDVVYVRYFLVGIAFLLVLSAGLLSALWRRSSRGRAICAVLVVTYVAVNGGQMARLFHDGRGEYREAIRYMKEHSHATPVTMAGDQDLRIGTELQYYGPTVMSGVGWAYYLQGHWPPDGPEWFIYQKESFEDPVPPFPTLKDDRGRGYEYAMTYPAAPLVGLHWFLYHRTTP